MRKICDFKILLSFLSLFLLSFSISYSYNDENIEYEIYTNFSLEKQIDNYDTQWVKSWIVKNALKWIASTLRIWWSYLENLLKNAWAPNSVINSIFNNRYSIANTLDNIADNFNYISNNVKFNVYQIMQQQWFSHSVSWYIAQIVDFIAF